MPLVWSAGSILGYAYHILSNHNELTLSEPDPWWVVISPSSPMAGNPRKNRVPQGSSVLSSMFCSRYDLLYHVSEYHCWT